MRALITLTALALALTAPAHAEPPACLDAFAARYVHETERNLSRVFALAEQSDVALSFDEADALFEGRTQVRQGHDRYDLAEIDHLLARIERFQNVEHLASNARRTLIAGFDRASRTTGLIITETETGVRVIEFARATRARALAYAQATLEACPAG